MSGSKRGSRNKVQNLETVLDDVEKAGSDSRTVTIADVRKQLGRRSFGPILMLAALPCLTPVSAVPGVPAAAGLIFTLVGAQILFGRSHLWLPEALLSRRVQRSTISKMTAWLEKVAQAIDKFVRPRLTWLTEKPSIQAVALCVIALGVVMLPLAAVPFTSGIPALPVAVFGLALTARDGAFVIAGFAVTGACAAALVAIWYFGGALLGTVFG